MTAERHIEVLTQDLGGKGTQAVFQELEEPVMRGGPWHARAKGNLLFNKGQNFPSRFLFR